MDGVSSEVESTRQSDRYKALKVGHPNNQAGMCKSLKSGSN